MCNLFVRSLLLLILLPGLPLVGAASKEDSTKYYGGYDGLKSLLGTIKGIKPGGTIRASLFCLTDTNVIKAMLAALKSGVSVDLMLSERLVFGRKEHEKLIDAGATIQYVDTHEKTIICRQPTGEAVMQTGSRNLSGVFRRWEDTIETKDLSAIDAVEQIWDNRNNNKKPQILSPLKIDEERPSRLLNTPEQGKIKVVDAVAMSAGRALGSIFARMALTPPHLRKKQTREAHGVIMCASADGDLFEIMQQSAITHPHTKHTLTVGQACAETATFQKFIADQKENLAKIQNFELNTFKREDGSIKKKIEETEHRKLTFVSDSPLNSMAAFSTGNDSRRRKKGDEEEESNMTFITHCSNPEQASQILRDIKRTPRVPFYFLDPKKPGSKKSALKESTSKEEPNAKKAKKTK